MQHFKEFLTRIQTFDLRIIEDDIHMEWGTNEKKHVKVYDLSHQTQYYDSFSYRSELRVLKDMAFIDLVALDKERIKLQLEELAKVRERFKEFWRNYHDHHSEMTLVYERHFIFSVNLEYLFIVNGLQSTNAEIEVSSKFAEDLGESVKLREKFLRELIYAIETAIKPKRSEAEFKEWLDAERAKQEAATAETTNETLVTPQSEIPHVPETTAVQEAFTEPELNEEQLATFKLVGYYPTFKEGAAAQLFDLLKTYFVLEEHAALEKLLLNDEAPARPLLFRGSATQLADAFKQLKEANLIVGCRMSDLERWIAPKFLYLSPQSQPRELPEDYLNGLMSTKGRPCKSPILKIEQKEEKFFILPAPATKNSKKMRGRRRVTAYLLVTLQNKPIPLQH